jgi:hypothetical protein
MNRGKAILAVTLQKLLPTQEYMIKKGVRVPLPGQAGLSLIRFDYLVSPNTKSAAFADGFKVAADKSGFGSHEFSCS